MGIGHDYAESVNKGHGRLEHRRSFVLADPEVMDWIQHHHKWPGLAAIGMVQARREDGKEQKEEARYYLLSRKLTAVQFGEAVRGHWGIEHQDQAAQGRLDRAYRLELLTDN